MTVSSAEEFFSALTSKKNIVVSLTDNIEIPNSQLLWEYLATVRLDNSLKDIKLYGNNFSIIIPPLPIYELFGKYVTGQINDVQFVINNTKSNYIFAKVLTNVIFFRCQFSGTFQKAGQIAGLLSWQAKNVTFKECDFRVMLPVSKAYTVSAIPSESVEFC